MTSPSRMQGAEQGSVREIGVPVAILAAAVLLATGAAAVLEQWVGVLDASPVYLVPVVVAAALFGTWAAVGTSLVAFLAYDFLFTTPRFTFAVSDPGEWLSLLLFLIIAAVIGRLTGLLRDRADEADRRVREGVALVAMSREVAMTATFEEAAAHVAGRLAVDAEMAAVWVTLADAPDWVVAAAGEPIPGSPGVPWTLARSPGDTESAWLRVHPGDLAVVSAGAPPDAASADGSPNEALDVPAPNAELEAGDVPEHYVAAIEADAGPVGWIHVTREAGDPRPGRGARRLLALAADQLGIAVRRDQFRAERTAAEVGRQSDALRAAILDSVSHDLTTPIASIRALAGGLADAADDPDSATVRDTAAAIDAEGARLGRLVTGLLDMGRIQADAIHPDLRPYDLAELIETALRSHPAGQATHPVDIEIPDDLPPVLADAVLFDVALGNVIDNAADHAPDGTRIHVRALSAGDGRLRLEVDDAGGGVPADALPHLFDRFYRVPADHEGARHGMGMGLAIARGFVEAMGGTITAEASQIGGLGIRITLRATPAERP